MALVSELRPGTRCMVDVAAMERDGPDGVAAPLRCPCWLDIEPVYFKARLRALSESVVTVIRVLGPLKWNCRWCGAKLVDTGRDFVEVAGEGLMRAKYLVPLPK